MGCCCLLARRLLFRLLFVIEEKVRILLPALLRRWSSSSRARAFFRPGLPGCHDVCSAAIDPGEPSAHLSSSCFQGLYTRRHDYVQRFGAAPIHRQLPGRPTVHEQNVTGTHGAGTDELDIVCCSETTGVAGSLPLFVDVCVTDPTTKSNIDSSGAARVPGCSAATRYTAKIRLNPGGTPKIDTSAREFLPWAVADESFGRVCCPPRPGRLAPPPGC